MLIDVIVEAIVDSLKLLPFLFLAFLLLEYLEHHASSKTRSALQKSGKAGPIVGAALGLIPQCGFSAMAANFYAERYITTGTLLAVFLATSDEALVIILAGMDQNSGGERAATLLLLIGVKLVIAVAAGYLVDLFFRLRHRNISSTSVSAEFAEEQDCNCCCGHDHCNSMGGFVMAALRRTCSIWLFLLAITLVLGLLIEWIGEEHLAQFLLADTPLQPFLTALVGLIPNCVPSVLLAELYLQGSISFGAVVSGLCTAAGLGLLVLFRENRNLKENLGIMGALYGISALSGLLLQLMV